MKVCPSSCEVPCGDWSYCPMCGSELIIQKEPINVTFYLHGSKESNYEDGRELGLSDEALDNFVYTCYELAIQLKVNPMTGKSKMTGVITDDGVVLLEYPVDV